MKEFKPVLNKIKDTKTPILGNVKDQLTWSFSFKYFKQIEYFGLGESDTKWFVSVLNRLRDLGKENIDNFLKDHRLKETNRYHKINWDAKNIPLQRDQIDWIEKDIIENEEDYPFMQFQVSTGLGRVIGFWKENYSLFYIVLLDPRHNMQPSKNFNYKVDNTTILPCEFSSLLTDIDDLRKHLCNEKDCNCRKKLINIPTNVNRGNFVYFQLDDEYYSEFEKLSRTKSVREIIEAGLIYLSE